MAFVAFGAGCALLVGLGDYSERDGGAGGEGGLEGGAEAGPDTRNDRGPDAPPPCARGVLRYAPDAGLIVFAGGDAAVSAIAAPSLNGDQGPVDLVFSFSPGAVDQLDVVLRDPTGGFLPAMPTTITDGGALTQMVVGTFHLDAGSNNDDIAYLGAGAAALYGTLLGDGQGSFSRATLPPSFLYSLPNPTLVAAGEIRGVFPPDLVVGQNPAVQHVVVLFNDGTGAFAQPTTAGFTVVPYGLALADVNHDGHLDIAVLGSSGAPLVALGDGSGFYDGGSALPVSMFPGYMPSAPSRILVADLNGDSRPDLVAIDTGDSKAAAFLGAADGGFTVVPIDTSTGGKNVDFGVGDVNCDGVPDIVALGTNGTVSLIVNDGDAGFVTQLRVDLGGLLAGAPTRLAVVDLNGDGVSDLVAGAINAVVVVSAAQ